MMTTTDIPTSRTARRRIRLFAGAATVAAVDLVVKQWAIRALADGGTDAGALDLRLVYNSGTAFGLGSGAPSWLVVGVTACITVGVAVVAWRAAPGGPAAQRAGFAAVLGGALANVADRGADGAVTDYLHTGWWPTFNLADVAICVGAGLLLLAHLRPARAWRAAPAEDRGVR